jgi:MFS family permease
MLRLLRRWVSVLPAGVNARKLLVIGIIDSIGTGLYLAGSAILFTTVVHLSSTQIGRAVAIGGAVGLFSSVVWGGVADRIGARTTLVLLNVWRAAGFIAYAFVHDFTSYLGVTVFLGLVEKAMPPVMLAVVATVIEPDQRVRTLAYVRSVRNIGFTIGSLLASLALVLNGRVGLDLVMVGNGLTFLIAGYLLSRLAPVTQAPPEVSPPVEAAAEAVADPTTRRRLLGRPGFVLTAAANGILSLHMAVLAIGLPLWVAHDTDAPVAVVPVLTAINTVLATALQVRFSRGCDEVPSASAASRRAALALAGMCVLIAASHHGPVGLVVTALVGSAVLLTLGELWQSAGGWGLALSLAPDEARGRYLSLFNLGVSVTDICGVLLLTSVVLRFGSTGWLALGVLFVVTAALVRPVASMAARERERRTQPVAVPAAVGLDA